VNRLFLVFPDDGPGGIYGGCRPIEDKLFSLVSLLRDACSISVGGRLYFENNTLATGLSLIAPQRLLPGVFHSSG